MNQRLWRRLLRISLAVLALCVLAGAAVVGVVLSANRTLTPDDCPQEVTHQQMTAAWTDVLAHVVRDDRVDYEALRLHRPALQTVVCGVANSREELSSPTEELAFLINAYNALVLYAVLQTEVTTSVHDVRVPLVPIDGYGFFYSLYFEVRGERVNLYGLEHQEIRARFADARIHAALNCASASCPPLSSEPYDAADLDSQLQRVATAFVSSPAHVRLNHGLQRIELSSLFEWYDADFASHARAMGAGETSIDWIAEHATPEVAQALRRARDDGWPVDFVTYDWSLNAAISPPG